MAQTDGITIIYLYLNDKDFKNWKQKLKTKQKQGEKKQPFCTTKQKYWYTL